MKRLFLISKQPTLGLAATVFAAGAASPLDMLEDVEESLRSQGVRGKVVFDLLLSHGNKINRYVYGVFDGHGFTSERLRSAQTDYEQLASLSADFLRGHLDDVDPSLLSRPLRFALRRGIAI